MFGCVLKANQQNSVIFYFQFQIMQVLHPKRSGRTVPSFLKRTYQMLEDTSNVHIVKWNCSGVGFVVLNEIEFSQIVLPKYFKHSKYSSFVRQLNMYNFHKIRSSSNENRFIHEQFIRNDMKSIECIKRKPERKKKKSENNSVSDGKDDSNLDDLSDEESQRIRLKSRPKRQQPALGPTYPVENITIRITNQSRQNQEVFHCEATQNCLKNAPSDSNTAVQRGQTQEYLHDNQDNISIQDGIDFNQRSQLRIPTRLMFNQGSGIFPIHTGMISIYSLSNLIK